MALLIGGEATARRSDVVTGVGQLFYKSLRAVDQDTLPVPIQAWLHTHTQQVFVHSSLLARELLSVLAAFEAQGLPAISYKGPILATSAYRDLALRPFGDVDIWVHRKNVERGKGILFSLGYQPERPQSVRDEETYLRHNHDYPFVKKSEGKEINVDLQWGISEYEFSFPIEFQPV